MSIASRRRSIEAPRPWNFPTADECLRAHPLTDAQRVRWQFSIRAHAQQLAALVLRECSMDDVSTVAVVERFLYASTTAEMVLRNFPHDSKAISKGAAVELEQTARNVGALVCQKFDITRQPAHVPVLGLLATLRDAAAWSPTAKGGE